MPRRPRLPVRDISAPAPPGRLARPIVVRALGELLVERGPSQGAHRHDFHLALLVARGRGRHTIDGEAYPARAGSLFLLAPGQAHAHDLEPGTDGYLVAFSPAGYRPDDLTREALGEVFAHDCLRLRPEELTRSLTLVAALAEAIQPGRRRHPAEVRAHLELVLLHWHGLLPPVGAGDVLPGPGSELLRRLRALIARHGRQHRPLAWYAGALTVGPDALARRVRRELATTVARLQRDYLLAEAKRLLRYTDLTVAEVADDLGYGDASHFVQAFRKAAGQTPGAWRGGAGKGQDPPDSSKPPPPRRDEL